MDSLNLPCLVRDMDFPTYLGDPMERPSLTSSLARSLLRTAPRAVWERTPRLNPLAKPEVKTQFDLGTAAHAAFVGAGEEICVIEADSYRTKAAKEQRDEAYANGHTPILAKDMERVSDMADAANDYFANHSDIGSMISDPNLLREATVMWEERGIMARCRPDLYAPAEIMTDDPPCVIHYKTTGNELNAQTVGLFAANQGWDIIAAHYDAGVFALTGEHPRQVFAIQEVKPPYLCMVVELSSMFLAVGALRRRRAVYLWRRCIGENNWPGHIDRTIRVSVPPWHENAATEAKDAEQKAYEEGTDLLDMAKKWQAPILE